MGPLFRAILVPSRVPMVWLVFKVSAWFSGTPSVRMVNHLSSKFWHVVCQTFNCSCFPLKTVLNATTNQLIMHQCLEVKRSLLSIMRMVTPKLLPSSIPTLILCSQNSFGFPHHLIVVLFTGPLFHLLGCANAVVCRDTTPTCQNMSPKAFLSATIGHSSATC